MSINFFPEGANDPRRATGNQSIPGEARLRNIPPFDPSVVQAAVNALGDMKSPYAFGGGYCEISSCSAPSPSSKGFLDNLLASIGGTSGTKTNTQTAFAKPTGRTV